ncbi:MAG: DUF2130 domain-containing protein [Thermodesulfobacteriota bacterium]|nr:DUF2130 domain-containing protein [Thermodesulfobacteriota bacterium]
MEKQRNTIRCPHCGAKIDVNDVIYHQIEAHLKDKFDADLAREKEKLDAECSRLEEEKRGVEKEKGKVKEAVDRGIRDGIAAERKKLTSQLRKELQDETSAQMASMQEELNRKSEQLKGFNEAKSEIERLKREKEEVQSTIQAKLEAQFSGKLKEEKSKLQKAEEEKVRLKVVEKDQVIEQLKTQLQEAQRKAEQGSMQLQGEVQELAIEQWLRERFPLDTIEEIKKGARGGDCIQIVNTRNERHCGSIYYESKRTKTFQLTWIEKFKTDIREKGANIGVLITEAMPADMKRMGMKEGIWICTLEEFKGLCVVLRESVIQISNAVATQENKGEKMAMLYDYLTSNEFRLQIEAIVEGFVQMKTDLDSEKRSMRGIWKKREKQIDKVILNTSHMYSSIKGIAGTAIQPVKQLELPEGDIEE